ncbi:hypothetical protein QTJ16_006553 [Diplocarpon rosae]|uniref:Phospholipase/carboxylesterase/thioesterase domain-containing protein n=1 Tax=Diplocarpon rosae TaxID=946125 RepID=A0AAD9SVW7_9HELO|nr:hypothetical protein QTJ16_006553 [Diplocarpon rosae]
MAPRVPSTSDFPPSITLSITPPPSVKPPLNTLILLHGLGDTQASFARLARQLNLPETVCISLRGPNPIPPLFTGSDTPAFHWGDDVLVDESRGEIDPDAGFGTITRVLGDVVGVLKECGFDERDVTFLGFGQGGMAALNFCSSRLVEFGGVISVGGKMPSSFSSSGPKAKTPILLLGGSKSTQVTRSAVDALKAKFAEVEYVKWEKPEDTMPRSREEMLPIMRFLARRLRSRAGVPDGAVEI